jgi:hypothetical protein
MADAAKWLMGDTNEKLGGCYRGGRDRGAIKLLSLGQGVFYLATGLWPLLNIRTFERVTGPKTDKWFVKTAGVGRRDWGGAQASGGATPSRPGNRTARRNERRRAVRYRRRLRLEGANLASLSTRRFGGVDPHRRLAGGEPARRSNLLKLAHKSVDSLRF